MRKCFLNQVVLRYPQDILNKRNPRLVPYNLLDERTKKTNRDSVNNAVRTLIGYGYNIEPPDQESCKSIYITELVDWMYYMMQILWHIL